MPTRYNDGQPVEREKFLITNREIAARFGAVSFLPESLHGIWMHQQRTYSEENVRVFVDAEDTAESADFFRSFKEVLKSRFRQIDIWIVSYEIRIT